MPLLELLAQQVGTDAGFDGPWWEAPTTRILGRDLHAKPYVAIPIFLGALAVASFLVERLSMLLARRLTPQTETRLDDAFVAGLPGVVRTFCALLALNAVTHALLHEGVREVAGRIVLALSVVVFGLALTRFTLGMVDAWSASRPQVGPVAPGLRLAIKVGAIPLMLITVLRVFGVPVEAFLTALGIGSLAVALALQDVLKNVFAGIQLVTDQPVRAGDFVILSNGVRGTIVDVGLRSTRLRTADNNVVILPNTTLANEIITNVDLVDHSYTHTVTVGVAYGCDTRRVEAALLDESAKAVAEIPGFLPEEKPRVSFAGPGQSSLEFRIAVRLSQYGGQLEPLSELNHRLLARLRTDGIEIPSPARMVYVRGETALPGA